MAPLAQGTIEDTVARLALWCRRAETGFIRATFDDGLARDSVIQALIAELAPEAEVRFLDLPVAPSADDLALRLADELARLGPGIVSLQGFEKTLPPTGEALELALVALNSRRENFSVPGQLSIWWLPRHMEEVLVRKHHDLNSWFLRKVNLTEVLSSPQEITHASLFNRALRLHGSVNTGEAEAALRDVVHHAETNFGPNHPRTGTALNNLARLLSETNRLTEAGALFMRAWQIFADSPGSKETGVSSILNNLAVLLLRTSRYREAEDLLRRVLANKEKTFGPDNPGLVPALNNLAHLLSLTGRGEEAIPLLSRALEISRSSLGPNHPNTAKCLNNLGSCYVELERFDEAEQSIHAALAAYEANYGGIHRDKGSALNSLALVFAQTRRPELAEEYLRQALEMDSQILGRAHPVVANRLHNLGCHLFFHGQPMAAVYLLRESVSILAAASVQATQTIHGLAAALKSLRQNLLSTGLPTAKVERQLTELLQANGFSRKKAKQLARTA